MVSSAFPWLDSLLHSPNSAARPAAWLLGLAVLLGGFLVNDAATGAEPQTPLVPRAKFFGNPEKARPRLSPDGKRLAFVAPVEGVLNVWVSPTDDPAKAKPVTFDKHRGVTAYFWAYTSQHILYTQDKNGDEDDHVYCIDLDSGDIKDLTPIAKIAAQIEGVSEKFPDEILVGINDRDERHFHDIYRINLKSGERKLVQLNPGVAGFLTDDDFRVRFAMNFTQTAGRYI
jgi:dipeptidyl aminopeptidase/acylaminoacyl peptidase